MNRFGKFTYSPEPRKLVYRPSVDVFFESVAAHWGGKIAAVLLTGMGRDGALGLLTLRERGVYTIAQDKDTCAVYGMPKAAAEINAAVDILPLDMIGDAIVKFYMGDRGKQSSEVR
jgi:chemotaxis response regulator CheB